MSATDTLEALGGDDDASPERNLQRTGRTEADGILTGDFANADALLQFPAADAQPIGATDSECASSTHLGGEERNETPRGTTDGDRLVEATSLNALVDDARSCGPLAQVEAQVDDAMVIPPSTPVRDDDADAKPTPRQARSHNEAILPLASSRDIEESVETRSPSSTPRIEDREGLDATELDAFLQEISATHTALKFPCDSDVTSTQLVESIRSWSGNASRLQRVANQLEGDMYSIRLLPCVPAGSPSTAVEADKAEAVDQRFACILFDNGTYRGQVKRRTTLPVEVSDTTDQQQDVSYIPDGWGILTSTDGLRRIGQWRDGEQIDCGSLQSGVFTYHGDWEAGSGPTGYGIGTFAFGATFTGRWHKGRPYGLGRLQTLAANSTQFGWFYGLECVQPTRTEVDEHTHEACLRSHLPAHCFSDQPERGLFLMGQLLEDNRLNSIRNALNQWRDAACQQAIRLAHQARAGALKAWREAHIAEEEAITHQLHCDLRSRRTEMAELVNEIATGRQQYQKLRRTREFHANKLSTAIFQRDLARRCVDAQRDAIVLMKAELAEVVELLAQAKLAQEECQQHSQRLHHVKRQVENVSVKVNALKHQLRQRDQGVENQTDAEEAKRQALKTPVTPSHAKALHRARPSRHEMDGPHPFVCDTPGCSCGIPRDVFLRVGSVLNGE